MLDCWLGCILNLPFYLLWSNLHWMFTRWIWQQRHCHSLYFVLIWWQWSPVVDHASLPCLKDTCVFSLSFILLLWNFKSHTCDTLQEKRLIYFCSPHLSSRPCQIFKIRSKSECGNVQQFLKSDQTYVIRDLYLNKILINIF